MSRARRLILLQYEGPKRLTLWSMRIFLFRFLSNQRIVDLPKIFWWPLLILIIIPFRSKKTFRAYARVFDGEFFNLKRNSLNFFKELSLAYPVELLFLGNGSREAKKRVNELAHLEEDWDILPLYPQYSTASWGYLLDHFEAISKHVKAEKKILSSFYKQYAEALVPHLKAEILKREAELLLISFHSMPIARIKKGDSYQKECEETFKIIEDELRNILPVKLVYQSRFNSEGKWLSPFTSEVLKELAAKGIKNVAIYPASFLFDCVETTYELGEELAEEAQALSINLRLIKIPTLKMSQLIQS